MTCAGITGMTLCRAMLRRTDRRLIVKLDRATNDAFAWLYENYDVRNNANHGNHFYYYALYSLERAAELANVAQIHGYDWYFDGATELLHLQTKNGSWSLNNNVTDTCFALLFLKKTVAPAITR